MNTDLLLEMRAFLEETAETNEDTEFDPSRQYLVDALIELARTENQREMVEEFETPFVHPMITVQKWVEELKALVNAALTDTH